ncbi:MAG: cobyrinate a,c-diamide synthase [Gammaproteobacteria bacterium]
MNRIFVSAAHKSSGKTTVTLGLCAALRARNLTIQPFKKGPDYIDPMWLARAAGCDCHNLDFNTMSADEITGTVIEYSTDSDLALIEGNKGLYDGIDLDGSNSNAAIARLLNTPVVLVLDTRGVTRGIAPLLLGYQAFDTEINIAGVILNRVGGARHESKLRAVIDHYTDIPVIGAVPNNPDLEITERHLGLIPSNEEENANQYIRAIQSAIESHVDLDLFLSLSTNTIDLTSSFQQSDSYLIDDNKEKIVRLGIIRDAAFGFYYPDDLLALEKQGCKLIFIDAFVDTQLPDLDGLFIGGGFPETHMQALSANSTFRLSLANAIEAGLPVYAECGGLMYLTNNLSWKEQTYPMVGIIPADTVVCKKPQGRGYVQLKSRPCHLWEHARATSLLSAHEFHYSRLENLPDSTSFGFNVLRGTGIDGKHDGFIYKNLLACYSHQRHTVSNPWTSHFINFIRSRTPHS